MTEKTAVQSPLRRNGWGHLCGEDTTDLLTRAPLPQSIAKMVEGDCSGDYKRMLIALVDGH